MCGRYSIAVEPAEIEERFHAKFAEPFVKRYNAAPSQKLPVILNEDPAKIIFAKWGIVPPWFDKLKKRGDGLINVRAETLREKRTFRDDFLHRRCLVVADGFYEWRLMPSGSKAPYRIRSKDGSLLAFAGIWETSSGDAGDALRTFAIVTTAANSLMESIHSRMPVVLSPEEKELWLGGKPNFQLLLNRLKPKETENLEAYEVSKLVNRAAYDKAQALDPV